MQSRSDIDDLYKAFGGDPGQYQEIGQKQKTLAARNRWPILSDERPGANLPIAPAVDVAGVDALGQTKPWPPETPVALIASAATVVAAAPVRRGTAIFNGSSGRWWVGAEVQDTVTSVDIAAVSESGTPIEAVMATAIERMKVEREIEMPDGMLVEHETASSQVQLGVPEIEPEPELELLQSVVTSPVMSISEPIASVVTPQVDPEVIAPPSVMVASTAPELIAAVPAMSVVEVSVAAPSLKGVFARLASTPCPKVERSGGSTSSE